MEKTTFDVSAVHFLLMFGYKLFSLYYPLFLVSIGFSILNVGSIYLLTYSVIAVSSVIINYYIHKFNPSKVAAFGIAGYGVFALMMIASHSLIIFYLAQIILGVSAAAWLVSLRLILMKSKTDSHSRSFGWFYSMPHYASVFAPVIGGIVIWKFGFTGVFALSVVIQFANAFYAYFRLQNTVFLSSRTEPQRRERSENIASADNFIYRSLSRYRSFGMTKKIIGIIKTDKTFIMILISILTVLILGGIYRAFFVLFLENMYFSQEEIIKFISIISIAYLPLSIVIIKIIEKLRNRKIISGGIIIEGTVTIILGIFASVMSLFGLFILMMVDSLGAMAFASGKSSYLSKKFKDHQEEASVVDTILTTIGPALGALIGGIAISYIGFQNTFLFAGIAVFSLGVISWFVKVNQESRIKN